MAQKRIESKEGSQYCYQYAAKFLCTADIPGTSQTSSSVVPGVYQTAVNIHNPNTERTQFRVKIVVAEPSKFIEDELAANHATRWDCDRITIAFGPFIHGVEGFLVIESTHSLDVTAVYTAGKVGGQVESIAVEQIHERQMVKKPGPSPELEHFKVYEVEKVEVDFRVRLTDQLDDDPKEANLEALSHFANPTRKVHAGVQVGIKDNNRHLNWYAITQQQPEPRRTIRYLNQFGQHSVDIGNPRFLLVPSQKTSDEGSVFPESLDHYKCYEVIQVNTAPVPPVVTLGDQFGSEQNVQVGKPRFFCFPVMKERVGAGSHDIVNADDHLAVYEIPPKAHQLEIKARDQFGKRALKVIRSVLLAVPTEKQVVVTHEN